MSKLSIHEQLLQSNSTETSEIFNDLLRGAARLALFDLMQEEVLALCGPAYNPPADATHRRAGSEKGVCYMDGGKEHIRRPRVRRIHDDGQEEEVLLKSYQAARCSGNIREEIASLLLEGVSTRGASRLKNGSVSKSTVSKQWIAKSAEKLEEFRSRPLAKEGYLVLMLDGVRLSDELTAIVALGIREDGSKEILDFKVGCSENTEVFRAISDRGNGAPWRSLLPVGPDPRQK